METLGEIIIKRIKGFSDKSIHEALDKAISIEDLNDLILFHVDLFRFPEYLPKKVLKILNKMGYGEIGIDRCKKYNDKLIKHGFSFDYDLSGEPYHLKKISRSHLLNH